MFNDAEGRSLSRGDAMLSGHATGVPGTLPALAMAHAAHGRLAWSGLFGAAERRAEQGFAVTPRMHRHIAGTFPQASAPDVKAMFAREDGTQSQPGTPSAIPPMRKAFAWWPRVAPRLCAPVRSLTRSSRAWPRRRRSPRHRGRPAAAGRRTHCPDLPPIARLHGLRATAAGQRSGLAAADDDPRRHRHRRPRPGRSPRVAVVRRSQSTRLCRPRPLRRRPTLRRRARRRFARAGLHLRAAGTDRRACRRQAAPAW